MLLLLWLKPPSSGCRIHQDPVFGVQRETGATVNEGAVIFRARFKAIMELGRRQTQISLVPDGFIFGFFLAFHFIR